MKPQNNFILAFYARVDYTRARRCLFRIDPVLNAQIDRSRSILVQFSFDRKIIVGMGPEEMLRRSHTSLRSPMSDNLYE